MTDRPTRQHLPFRFRRHDPTFSGYARCRMCGLPILFADYFGWQHYGISDHEARR